jgi:DNA-binding FrmR family transcriptional regulator
MMDSALQATALAQHKRSMITRLRRVEGQLRGIQSMIDADAGCEAVAQQIAAARRALDRAFYEMVACSMEAEMMGASDLSSAKAAGTHVAKILAKYG